MTFGRLDLANVLKQCLEARLRLKPRFVAIFSFLSGGLVVSVESTLRGYCPKLMILLTMNGKPIGLVRQEETLLEIGQRLVKWRTKSGECFQEAWSKDCICCSDVSGTSTAPA